LYILAIPFKADCDNVPVKIDLTLLSERIFFDGGGMEESDKER
jgi:hypothetical protein